MKHFQIIITLCLLVISTQAFAKMEHSPMIKVVNPQYPVTAWIPKDWIANSQPDKIISSDSWCLRKEGDPWASAKGPYVRLLLGWLPRTGRQTAFFPGEVGENRIKRDLSVAGYSVTGVEEDDTQGSGKFIRVDLEVGELGLSVVAHISNPSDRAMVLEILKNFNVEKTKKPVSRN